MAGLVVVVNDVVHQADPVPGAVGALRKEASNYETVQIKGRHLRTTRPSVEDLLRVDRHHESFAGVNESLGVPRARVEAFWRRELAGSPLFVTIHFVVHAIFNQTPGPAAGAPR